MDELTAFQRDVLYVIAGSDEPHGLAIKNLLKNYYGEDINHGQLYPNLDELTEEGLLKKGQKDNRTNWYKLTELGLETLQNRRSWEDELLETTDLVSSP